MTFFDTMINKGKEMLTSVVTKQEKVSPVSENLDAKIVFQDTKKSLEELKQTIFEQTDIDKRKSHEQDLILYIDRLLEFSVLNTHDKDFLIKLKQHINTDNSLDETQFEQIIVIVSHLEKKAETLNDVDHEKIKELQRIISEQKISLNLLKEGVSSVTPTLEEAKKKAFDKIKTDLESHRWSSWLAKPVYDYLVDKHINKKSVSKFKEWLIGTVGLTVVGWFVGSDLKNLISNIDNLSIENIQDTLEDTVETVKESISDLAHKEKEIYHSKLENGLFNFFEKKFGKSLDKEKFKKIFAEWSKERDPKTYFNSQKEKIETANNQGGSYDTLGEFFSLVSMPAKGLFDLLIRMKNEGLISWGDIVMDTVILPSGKAVMNLGIGSVGLFSNTMKTVFSSMSVEDLTEYIKEHNERLDIDSKMALWGMLYRRGGWFWNLAGHVGTLAGEGMSLLFMDRGAGNLGKVSAYWKGGVMADFEKELKIFDKLDESLRNTGIFNEIKTNNGATILDDVVGTMKKNLAVFDIMQNAKTFPEIESALRRQGLDDILVELKHSVGWGNNIKKVQTVAGNIIENATNKSLSIAEDSFGTWKKVFGKHLNFPWSKFPYEMDLIKKMKNFSKLQGKMLQSEALGNNVKNLFRKFSKGKQLAGFVEYSDEIKFSLSNVDEAKDFFDNIKTIGRHSPEILKTLFKGFPLIMMGKDMMDKLAHPEENQSFLKVFAEGFGYLLPLIGPIMLVSDGLTLKDGKFQSLSSAGIGAGLLTLDGFYGIKALSKGEFWRYMVSPIRDSISFMKSVGKGGYGIFKMTRDGVRILKAGEYAAFGAESLKLLKSSGLKVAGVALLCYLGYLGINEFMDGASEEERKQLANLQNMSNEEIESQIQKDWETMDDSQKSILIKVATAQKMGINNFDLLKTKKEGNQISIKFSTLIDYRQMKEVEQDLQQALSGLESTKDIQLHYSLDGGAIKYDLLAIKKQHFTDSQGTFDEQTMRLYLAEMAYSKPLIDTMIEKIV